MKQQRKTAEDQKEHVLAVMKEVRAQVTSQREFTAERVAAEAGISKVWLYHIASEEFSALRAQLPGSRKTRDEELAALRQENAQLRMQLEKAEEQARLASSTALKKAYAMLEQWEQETLELRGHIRLLTHRLEQVGGYVNIVAAAPSQADRKGHLKAVDA
jgi:uncharacterized protein YciW